MTDLATRRRIFRAAALDRLSSPEQLDELITVTRPSGWLAMAALWLGLIALATWAVSGRVTTRVTAQGIILGGQVVDITPAWGGQVTQMLVDAGDTVALAQLVAVIDQPDLVVQIRHQRARVLDLQTELRQRTAASDSTLVIQRRYYTQQRQNLEESAREQDTVVRALLARVSDERAMLERGLLSRDASLQSQQSLNTARDALARIRADLTQLGASQLSTEALARETLITATLAANDAQRELQRLEQQFAMRSRVQSPASGVLLERLVDAGDVLDAGQPIARVRLPDGSTRGLRAMLYVAGEQGKRVKVGMEIQVAPSSVRAEEHGYMVARVRRITELPASSQAIKQALRNDALVASVAALSAPFQIEADFVRDTAAPSGYLWTSKPGPPATIDPGTPARALVVVERRRPVEMILPTLRRAFNLQ